MPKPLWEAVEKGQLKVHQDICRRSSATLSSFKSKLETFFFSEYFSEATLTVVHHDQSVQCVCVCVGGGGGGVCVCARAHARVCVCVRGCVWVYLLLIIEACLPYLTDFDLIAVLVDCLVFQNCDSASYLWFVLLTGTGVKPF